MFPPSTSMPPMPPDIQAQQQQQPQPAGPTFAQMGSGMGGGIADPVSLLEQQVAKLEAWAAETAPIANLVRPTLTTLLIPIAQAGKALQSEIAGLRQSTSGPSPQVSGSVPPNVPGNMPDAQPAM